MMTVRFPDGFSVQYNDARYAVRSAYGYTDLYDSEDEEKRHWIAQVPNTALIEVRGPCRLYDATRQPSEAAQALLSLIQTGKLCGHWDENEALVKIKAALSRFDAKRRRWK